MNSIRVCVVALVGLTATAVQASQIYAGTSELVTFRTCIAGGTPCDNITPILQQGLGGFPGALASSASLPLTPGFGEVSATVELSGVAGAPNLTAHASSVAGSRVNTNSYALQHYTFTGSSPATRTIAGTLEYSQINAPGGPYPGGIGGGLYADIQVFTLPGGAGFEVGDTPLSNFDALSAPFAQPGYLLLGEDFFNDVGNTPSGTANFGVTVTLNPGDSFFVWALIQTPAVDGGVIDVFSFATQWDDPSGLIPAAQVPEPATLALLGLGLAGLGFSRRRQ